MSPLHFNINFSTAKLIAKDYSPELL